MIALFLDLQRFFTPFLAHPLLRRMIMSSVSLWVVCQVFHFMGVGVLIGVVGFFDIRLLGGMRRISMSAAMDLMPWAIVAFLVNLVTGTVFLLGRPGVYLHAISLYFKFLFILLAGANAIIFQLTLKEKALAIGPGEDTPFSMKLIGATSLIAWFAVLYCGRMVPYLGNI